MKFGRLEIGSPKKEIAKKQNEDGVDFIGNAELAINKEIYGTLSDPEYLKTFGYASDGDYFLLRQSLLSTKQDAANAVSFLQNYFNTTQNPLFCQLRLSHFLHVVLGLSLIHISEPTRPY